MNNTAGTYSPVTGSRPPSLAFTMAGFGAGFSTGLVGVSDGNEENAEPVMAASW